MSASNAPRVPAYRLHKARGCAVVTLNGRNFYLGAYGSPESRAKYNRLVAEYLQAGTLPPEASAPRANVGSRSAYPVARLCGDFLAWAKREYQTPAGEPTGSVENVRQALRALFELFADTDASEFGPRSLKLLRERLVQARLARSTVNNRIAIVKRAFKWAVENEHVTPAVWHGLSAVSGLRCGRGGARETDPIAPASEEHVRAALAHMAEPVRAMVELQLLTGARPNEVVSMRASEIDRTGAVWVYRPTTHKNAWRGHERRVYFGPKAQDVLRSFLPTGPVDGYLFSPTVAELRRRDRLRKARRTPLYPSHLRALERKRNYTLTFDAAGNQTDDGKDYKYEYDAFYRLRKVKQTGNSALVAEYRYNGLGYKIAVHEDTDTDADVDSNDKWYYDAFDELWRQVARFRESDTSPKEEFVPHQAGAGGQGTSSYIDLVACRYKDANTAWTTASDGVLEEKLYYSQNQHADVVAIVASDGTQREGDRYSAYGVPFGLPGGDADSDGDCDSADVAQVQTWISGSTYDIRGDIDLDGDVDSTDKTAAQNAPFSGVSAGRQVLSPVVSSRRKAFGADAMIAALSAARYRVELDQCGRWMQRDPFGYIDGPSLMEFLGSNPVVNQDAFGTDLGCPSTTPRPDPGSGPVTCSGVGSSPSAARAGCLTQIERRFLHGDRCSLCQIDTSLFERCSLTVSIDGLPSADSLESRCHCRSEVKIVGYDPTTGAPTFQYLITCRCAGVSNATIQCGSCPPFGGGGVGIAIGDPSHGK